MEIHNYIAILISLLSLGVSIYTYNKTYQVRLDTRNLSIRKAYSEQFEEYSTLLHSEYVKLKDDLSALSTALCDANTSIGNVLDKYDHRSNKKHGKRHLRHVYVDLYRYIAESFKYELSWQNAENIYFRLATFKTLNHHLDLKKIRHNRIQLFKKKRKQGFYPEYTLMESDGFISSFIELSESINTSDHMAVFNEFVDRCKELKCYLQKILSKCKTSYKILESGTIKNGLQEFKLSEYPPLYDRYTQFMCLMNFIYKSSLNRLSKVTEQPYLPVSQIIYYGAIIEMMNVLLCKAIFSIRE